MRTHRVVDATNAVLVEGIPVEGEFEQQMDNHPRQRKRRRTVFPKAPPGNVPVFKVFCPCRKCDLKSSPTLRLLRIVEDHIALHGVGIKWKVLITEPTIQCYS